MKGIVTDIMEMALKHQNLWETVNWVLESDNRVRSKEDVALGYFMGSLMTSAVDVATDLKLNKINRQAYGKRLEQIYGKKEASKRLQEMDAKIEERRAKGGKQIKIELTAEEIEEIRKVLIPMIARFRAKIRQEEPGKNS